MILFPVTRDAPLNFTTRHSRRSLHPPYGGPDGQRLNRKLIYSRFRPVKSYRSLTDDRDNDGENVLTTCAFSSNSTSQQTKYLYAGTVTGDVKMFNIVTGEEMTHECHESCINHIQTGNDNDNDKLMMIMMLMMTMITGRHDLVITSSSWRMPFSRLWDHRGESFKCQMTFKEEEHLEFSKLDQDKVVGTRAEGVVTIYDLNTSQLVRTLTPTNSNMYLRYYSSCDSLTA